MFCANLLLPLSFFTPPVRLLPLPARREPRDGAFPHWGWWEEPMAVRPREETAEIQEDLGG